jgi:hypothetical protein
MQDTVDQAHGAVPRTLADIIEDGRRAVCGHWVMSRATQLSAAWSGSPESMAGG